MLVATKGWFHGGLISILFSVSEILSEDFQFFTFWECYTVFGNVLSFFFIG